MNNNNIIYEGRTYQNNELHQLIEDFKEYLLENPDIPPVFKAKVESNPYGTGKEQELWFGIGNRYLDSIFPHQHDIGGVDYAWPYSWMDGTYKGSITITKLPK